MSGRYTTQQYGEFPVALGVFTPGAADINIAVYRLSDLSAVAVNATLCTEIFATGVYAWDTSQITTPPTVWTEYLYIMTRTAGGRTHPDKFVVGGFPDISAKSLFDGYVHVDAVNGQAGTLYPIGTQPKADRVTDLVNGLVIANREGLERYMLHGAYATAVDHPDWGWEGVEPGDDRITFTAPASTAGAQFYRLGIIGDMNGRVSAKECTLANVNDLHGILNDCGISGEIKVASAKTLQCLRLASQDLIPGSVVDLQNGGINTIFLAGPVTGNIVVRNVAAANLVGISMAGGRLTLEATVDAGWIELYGYGEVIDLSGGSAAVSDNVVKGSRIDIPTSTVWDRMSVAHMIAGSIGKLLRDVEDHLRGTIKINKATDPWTEEHYTMIGALQDALDLYDVDTGAAINNVNPLINSIGERRRP
jgi:hypothetical protein